MNVHEEACDIPNSKTYSFSVSQMSAMHLDHSLHAVCEHDALHYATFSKVLGQLIMA